MEAKDVSNILTLLHKLHKRKCNILSLSHLSHRFNILKSVFILPAKLVDNHKSPILSLLPRTPINNTRKCFPWEPQLTPRINERTS